MVQAQLSTYAEAGGELRLKVGTNEARPLPPVSVDGLAVDPADTFANAVNLNGSWTPGGTGSQSVLINSKIENTTFTPLDFPGGDDEPGNRRNLFRRTCVWLRTPPTASLPSFTTTNPLGQNTNGTPNVNAITDSKKNEFVKCSRCTKSTSAHALRRNRYFWFDSGRRRYASRTSFDDTPGDGGGVIDINGPGNIYYEAGVLASNLQPATVLDIQDFSDSNLNGFGGSFQRAAMQGIGRLLGLGLADEVAALTVQSFDGTW